MDFVLDPLATLVLFVAAIIAWWRSGRARVTARLLIRFAAVLFAALSVAWALGLIGYPELAPVVAMIALSLGGAALGLSLFAVLARPLPPLASALALMLALAAGLAAPLAGQPIYALIVAVLAALLVCGVALGGFRGAKKRAATAMAAMLAIPLGGFAFLGGAFVACLLLFAAGLIGAARASEAAVEGE